MHEVSLVAELVAECARRVASGSVRTVRIRHASTIPEDVIRQAFDVLTRDTGVAHARLDAVAFVIELDCACGYSGVVPDGHLVGTSIAVCPECGTVSILPSTPEIELLEVVR